MMLACFFPTHVLFLDDNSNHLNSIATEVDEFKVIPSLFNNSVKALHYLQNEYKACSIRQQFLVLPEDHEFAHSTINVDIRAIHRIIINPRRFQDISVLVSDYSMPDMHGLDFLKHIQKMKIKKMMLTGEADANLAITAFNNGLIQKFIRKDAMDFSHELNAAIDELQGQYFSDLTGIVIDSIINDPNYHYSCLNNPRYPGLLEQICQELKIVEYYLLDEHGSCLMADLEGNLTILAVKSEASMQEHYAFAKEEAEANITEALQRGDKLPFFFSAQDLATPPTQWENYLYPAKKIGTKAPLYYAIIREVNKHIPGLSNITSFKDYLENL